MNDKKYYLYIKTSPFGLKYLGKTTKNPYIYNGSGKIWKRHLKKHNLSHFDIKTEVIFETNDVHKLIKFGNELSIKYDIVKSNEWANLRIENGDGGDTSKFIDYDKPNFHKPNKSKHLNTFNSEIEKKRIIAERTKKIDYNNPERLRKIKENTDWISWKKSIKNRKIDYVNMHRNVVNKKPILQLDLNNNIISEFNSISEASKTFNLGRSGIMQCLRKRNKTAYGYKWKYKNK
jgi:hypothetical protein